MRRVAHIAISLFLGTAFLFAMMFVGGIATLVVIGKSAHELVWITGAFYVPFFVGGAILALTRGFAFPRVLVPVCAFLAFVSLPIAGAVNGEPIDYSDPTTYLPLIAVPLSSAGCLVAQLLSRYRQPNDGSSAHPLVDRVK